MRLYFRFSLLAKLFLCFLLLSGSCKTVEETVNPALLLIQEMHDSNYTFQLGDHLMIEYEGRYGQLQGRVLQRKQPLDGNLIKDFQQHPENYELTNVCQMKDADYIVSTQQQRKFDSKVMKVLVDEQKGNVYLLAENMSLLVVEYNQSNLAFSPQTADLGVVPNANDRSFLFIHQKKQAIYIVTQKDILLINTTSQGKPKLSIVQGYLETQQPLKYRLEDDTLVLIHSESVAIYKMIQQNIFQFKSRIKTFQAKPIWVSDVYLRGRKLWILDQLEGLYHYEFDDRTYKQVNAYSIPYGRKLALTVQANTFQVTFQYGGETYIAQMFLQTQQLHLNRFYDKIFGVRQVHMINELLFVVGEIESMCIWHSVNQNYLLKRPWITRKFVSSLGWVSVTPLYLVLNQTQVMIVMGHQSIKFLTIVKSLPRIECDFRYNEQRNNELMLGRHSLYVELNTTSCNMGVQKSNLNSYCQTKHDFNFKIVEGAPRKKYFILSAICFLISLASIIALVCISIRYRARKKQQLRQMDTLLKQKIAEWQQYKKTHSSGTEAADNVAAASALSVGQSIQD